jgi:hypothetical protein
MVSYSQVSHLSLTDRVKATGINHPNPAYRDVYDDIKVISVQLRLVERKLVIEVWDSSPEPPVLKGQDFDAESRRGLVIVQSLSLNPPCK